MQHSNFRSDSKSKRHWLIEFLEPRRLLSAQLVKDINTQRPGADFVPADLTSAGSVAFFNDNDGVNGSEVWKTDGTAAGTQLVKDINPGPAGSYPGGYTTLNGITYFSAEEPTDGGELWRTDGTSAGTYLVKDIAPGPASSNPSEFTAYNGYLYFFANDGTHGQELWKTDGTTAGTVLVMDTYPGLSGQPNDDSSFHRITVSSNNVLIFTALDGTNNNLYSITGNGSPTLYKKLADFITDPGLLAGTGGLVFYTDILGYVDQTDGTAAGTITDDPTNNSVSNLTIGGNYLYYVRNGIVKCVGGGYVQTVSTGLTSATILGSLGSDVYFSALQTGNPQVWYTYSGGTFSGLVLNSLTGTAGVAVGSNFYFFAETSTASYSLYKVAAPPSSAILVASAVNPGGSLSAPSGLAALGTKLLFINTDTTNGTQPWVSDGTAAGTAILKSIYPGTAGALTFPFATVNGRLFFKANDGVTGSEPYSTDGTAAGTIELKDISPGSNSSSPTNVLVVGSILYFSAYDPTDGNALWKTDGTAAGTTLLVATGPAYVLPTPMGVVNGWVLFSASDAFHGTELWRTDGTPANTQLLEDIYPGTSSSSPSAAVTLNGYAYFTATDATHGAELWRTDGTAAGTTLVDDIYPGSSSSGVTSLFVYKNMLLCSAELSSSTGYELWRSDGTAAGTVLVKDIYPGSSSSDPVGFVQFNGLAYFSAQNSNGSGLYVTDGTSAGTNLITDDNPSGLLPLNGKLYFIGTPAGQSTTFLCSTEGSLSTTVVVADTPNSFQGPLYAIGGRLFFIADDRSGASYELWTSDGTATGTAMVQDLFPGELQGANSPLVGLNGAVFCTGDNSVTGRELYKFPDIYPPQLYAASANVAAASYTINFSFSENVSANLSATSLQLRNLGTNQTLIDPTSGYTYNSSTNTATFTLPAFALIDGRYRASIAASLVVDPQGNVATSAATFDFLTVAAAVGNNAILIAPSSDGMSLQVFKNSVLTFTTPLQSLNSLIVVGNTGNDSLSIVLSATLLPGGYSFDGGGGSNTISIVGNAGVHALTAVAGLLTYDEVQISFVNAQLNTFDPGGGSDAITASIPLLFPSAPGVGRTITLLNVSSTLDINNNNVDLSGTSLAAITALAQTGYNGGSWNGAIGLASTAAATDSSHLIALGVIQNNQGGIPLFSSSRLFDGTAPAATDVLVKYTWYGDANLDGKIDGSDYTRIDSGLKTLATGWFNGDFNYDGVVNGSDYTLIDNSFNEQGAAFASEIHQPATATPPTVPDSAGWDDWHKKRLLKDKSSGARSVDLISD